MESNLFRRLKSQISSHRDKIKFSRLRSWILSTKSFHGTWNYAPRFPVTLPPMPRKTRLLQSMMSSPPFISVALFTRGIGSDFFFRSRLPRATSLACINHVLRPRHGATPTRTRAGEEKEEEKEKKEEKDRRDVCEVPQPRDPCRGSSNGALGESRPGLAAAGLPSLAALPASFSPLWERGLAGTDVTRGKRLVKLR